MNLRYLVFLVLGGAFFSCAVQAQEQPHNLKSQPLLFLENKGQILDFDNQPRPDVLFMMRGKGVNVFVGKGELHYLFSSPMATPDKKLRQTMPEQDFPENPETQTDTTPTIYDTYRIDISLAGMNPNATVEALDKNAYYENYYNIPGHYQDGILNVRSFGKIRINNVYPNIDWLIYSKDGKLKHEFLLHPGARHQDIRLLVKGATNILVNETGVLEITTPLGTIVEDKPFIPENPEIQGSFLLSKTKDLEYEIGYELSGVNKITTALTIDPGIEWSTYFGGTQYEIGNATSSYEEQVYFGGLAQSFNYISLNAYQSVNAGNGDMYITRFSKIGTPVWATYFGGSGEDYLYSINACNKGILACGSTYNSGLGYKGYDTSFSTAGNTDGIVLLFDSSGSLKWSSYIGGNAWDFAMDVGAMANGNFFVSGYTGTAGLGTTGVYQTNKNIGVDNFISVIDSSGRNLQWFSYYGSGDEDMNYAGLCVKNDIYIVGSTKSNSGMTMNGFQNSFGGGSKDGYIAKFDSIGNLLWSSYYGSTGLDVLSDVATFNNDIYIVGGSYSASGMAYGNAYKTSGGGGNDMVLARVTSSGKLVWSTYYGDAGDQVGRSCVIDVRGKIWTLIAHSSSNSRLGKHLYYDVSFPYPNTDLLIARFDTACRHIDATFYFGVVNYSSPSTISTFCSAMATGLTNVYINLTDNGGGYTIRSKYQATPRSAATGFFVKWSAFSFATPKIITDNPICQAGKLKIYSEQYAVGRSPNGKTITQLSDSNGVFNGNTKNLYTRNDTLSRYEYITATIPAQCPYGKNYRVRMILNNPPDTSEPSLPFEIRQRPTGEILTPPSYQICDNDSLKLELDTQGANTIRWYHITSPTSNPADTNRIFYAKEGGKHSALLTDPKGCTYMTNSVNILQFEHSSAGFTYSKLESCFLGNNFTFTDTSKPASGDAIISSTWFFGDSAVSTTFKPTHTYTSPGEYLLKLGIATQRGCHDTAYQILHVWPSPKAKISVNDLTQCLNGNQFHFKDSTELAWDTISSREWKIDGKLASSRPQFDSSFALASTHKVELIVNTSHACTHDTSVVIKVSGHPNIDIQSSKPGFCPGDSVKLEVTNPNTWNYQWYQNGNKINGQTKTIWYTRTAGNYAVRAVNSDGCDTVSNAVKVMTFANPTPDLGADKTIRYDSAVTLNPGVFKTYQWNKGAITSTITVNKSNLDTGKNNIWVLVTDSNGCRGSDTVIVRLEPINGLDDPAMAGIRVYPIPAENILHVEIPNLPVALTSDDLSTSSNTYQMLSMDGRVALRGILKDKINSIDISKISAGTYILELNVKGNKYGLKLVK